jgi:hypothetical protein
MAKYWLTLYDDDDCQIASYQVDGDHKLETIILTFAIRHLDIEYVKITVNPPDES